MFLQAFEINTTFMNPLYLPCEVNMSVNNLDTEIVNNEQDFKVLGTKISNQQQPLHLIGHIRTF